MCMRCEGYSAEEIERATDLTIITNGYLLLRVTDEYNPWSYTVGLRESYDHPELVCVDTSIVRQDQMIRLLADEVADRGRIDDDVLRDADIELLVVDEVHLRDDLVVVWEERYDRSAQTGDFLQIRLGPSWYCEHHADAARRLDDPAAGPPARPNRARRRAAEKRRR